MSTIELDGRQIPFEKGETIIEAAHRAGIEIPHYCWHPGLSAPANCRMCLVEIMPPPGRAAVTLDVLRWLPGEGRYEHVKKPKLQPACQIPCSDGMVVRSDTSEHVRQARAAIQELLLLNHPVDCPICDQAGECRLQDYWLEHQGTPKRMHDEIVHKPKAVRFGPTIVYDAERCILCTRCIRVSTEVARDPVLDQRERGNLKEIVVAPGRELDHNYSLMTEHVCPVGALTSSDFRFKARVWFLRAGQTVCQGCARGCNAYLDFDPRTNVPYRYRPRPNPAVNRHWMCDVGMLSYPRAVEGRLLGALVGGEEATLGEALDEAKSQLRGHGEEPERVAFVLSAHHSLEDNFALVTLARKFVQPRLSLLPDGAVPPSRFFLARARDGAPDGVLLEADRNPNGRGCAQLVAPDGLRPLGELVAAIRSDEVRYVIALGAEVDVDELEVKSELPKLKGFVVLASHEGPLVTAAHVALPVCSWAEQEGTYVNSAGLAQRTEAVLAPRGQARPGWTLVARLARALGYAFDWKSPRDIDRAMAAATVTAAERAAQPGEARP